MSLREAERFFKRVCRGCKDDMVKSARRRLEISQNPHTFLRMEQIQNDSNVDKVKILNPRNNSMANAELSMNV